MYVWRAQSILLERSYSSLTLFSIFTFACTCLFSPWSSYAEWCGTLTNMTCTLASRWVWGKCKCHWQGTHRSFFLIMPESNTHFNEDRALYFTLCHASKRKSPWVCRAREVIGFRAVWGNCLSKIFSVLTTSSFCCCCLWRVHNFLSLHAKMRKTGWSL